MQLDAKARELEVTESDVLVLYQSRISTEIALEGERSQQCDAFVCGGKSGNDYWVVAVVYLNVGRRALVYRHAPIGRDKGGFDRAMQEAQDFLIPLGFELDHVSLKYSQAMRQVILKGIRGLALPGKGGAKKPLPAGQGGAVPKEVAEEAKEAAAAPEKVEAAKVEAAKVEAAKVEAAKVKAEAAPSAVAWDREREALQAALLMAEQGKVAAEASLATQAQAHERMLAELREEAADLRGQMDRLNEDNSALAAEVEERKRLQSSGSQREADQDDIIRGVRAELKEMRTETAKALSLASQAEKERDKALAAAEKSRQERDAQVQAAAQERLDNRAAQEQLTADLAKLVTEKDKLAAELSRMGKAAAQQEEDSRRELAIRDGELEQVRREQAVLSQDLEQARLEIDRVRQEAVRRRQALEGERDEAQAALAAARDELAQLRDELATLQEDSSRLLAAQEEQRRRLAERAQGAEAEVDRLMQSLVDLETEWSARVHGVETAMTERVSVLKGVVEQLWPVGGESPAGAMSPTDLARIAAAPLKLATVAPVMAAAPAATSPAPAAIKARPLPKIPIVPDLEEVESPDSAVAAEAEFAAEDGEEIELTAPAPLAEAEKSPAARFFDTEYLAGPGGGEPSAATVSISFDDEDWSDLDLSSGDDGGEPVQFRQEGTMAGWTVDLAQVRELYTTVNVQQIAPPGGGPGTYQGSVCLADKGDGTAECCVVIEQVGGGQKKLVYVPEHEAAPSKLVKDGCFFLESIGFMLLAVELGKQNAKRAAALEKCRSFIRS